MGGIKRNCPPGKHLYILRHATLQQVNNRVILHFTLATIHTTQVCMDPVKG